MFQKTENNYIFILTLWGISLLIEYVLHQAGNSIELKQMIQTNIFLVPQFQMLAYSVYLGLFLYVNTYNNIGAPKYKRTPKNVIILVLKSSTSFSIVFVDLIMITVLTFSIFNTAFDVGNNFPYNWHILFLHVIAPLLALFMTWNLRNQKIEFRESTIPILGSNESKKIRV